MIIPGWNWPSFDEFHGYNGDCMEYALEFCLAAIQKRRPRYENVNALVQTFQQKGWAGSNGATTINACISYAAQEGYRLIDGGCYGYSEPAKFDLSHVLQFAGEYPILLNVSNGAALRDVWTGQADESGLHYHGIAILGTTPNGNYACADGDNPASSKGRYEEYYLAELEAAKPVGILTFGK